MYVKSFSRVRLFATPWTVAYQASPSTGFSRQKYWSGIPFPSPGDLPNPGIEPRSPTLEADALTSEPPGKPEIEDRCNKQIGNKFFLYKTKILLLKVVICNLLYSRCEQHLISQRLNKGGNILTFQWQWVVQVIVLYHNIILQTPVRLVKLLTFFKK